MAVLLSQIQEPADLKNLTMAQLTPLAAEIRQFLIEKLSVTGGSGLFKQGYNK